MLGYTTADIRNIAVTGPAAAGKTTLIEQMLFSAGAIGRALSHARHQGQPL